MFRFRVPELFLGCFLTIAVFAVGMLFSRPYPQPTAHQVSAAAANNESKEKQPEGEPGGWGWLVKDAAGFFTFGLVAVGIGQAFLFFIQLRYMRTGMADATRAAESATVSAETARRQLDLTFRPKIRLKHLWLTSDIWADQQIEFTAVFVNSGSAAAVVTEVGLMTHLLKAGKQLPSDPTFPSNRRMPLDHLGDGRKLAPGVSMEIKKLSDFRHLSDADNVAIREGSSHLYCVGYAQYTESGGAVRKTSFCRILDAKNINAAERGRFRIEADPDYEYED